MKQDNNKKILIPEKHQHVPWNIFGYIIPAKSTISTAISWKENKTNQKSMQKSRQTLECRKKKGTRNTLIWQKSNLIKSFWWENSKNRLFITYYRFNYLWNLLYYILSTKIVWHRQFLIELHNLFYYYYYFISISQ